MDAASEIRHRIKTPISWARVLTKVGAIASCIWVVYRVDAVHGLVGAMLAFVGLAIVYAIGVSPAFTVAASVVCFVYGDVGFWLPLTAYVFAAIFVLTDLKHGGSIKAEQRG